MRTGVRTELWSSQHSTGYVVENEVAKETGIAKGGRKESPVFSQKTKEKDFSAQ